MAVDETLLGMVLSGHRPTTVRVYGWRPRAISVGYGQPVLKDIDIEKCVREGVDIVRRLTGGRAVLHDEEVTYSVVAPENGPGIGGTITETYRRIGLALICGLKHVGLEANLHRATSIGRHNPSCFSSAGRYEIVYRGKKLIGSAQRRLDGVILQHGSLLTGSGYRDLARFLRSDGPPTPVGTSMGQVTTLSEVLGDKPQFDTICDALRRGFEEAFGCRLIEHNLSDEEQALVEKLRLERYDKDDWNLRR
ncbi:MAG: lipoate--protein ligase family protein [Gemmatimonadota bacterium]|nr:MAG: lipoate--protein ligase family protein [Gemmatimonadota bacterium]